MKFPSPVSVQWIADFLGAQLIGDKNGHATGINEIHKVEKGDLVFVDHPKYYDKCINSAASYIIIDKAVEQLPAGKALLVVDQALDDPEAGTRLRAADLVLRSFFKFNENVELRERVRELTEETRRLRVARGSVSGEVQ